MYTERRNIVGKLKSWLKLKDVFFIILYRPPPGSIPIFMDFLYKQLEQLQTGSHPLMILWDFDIDLQELDMSVSMDFCSFVYPTLYFLLLIYAQEVHF